ncbi:hypothetical protein [Streptomyces parvus]|uniref:hypothetical protein n=1 Tax=Streptomyces parvus TaxID=66428 RepID=UPI0035D715EF
MPVRLDPRPQGVVAGEPDLRVRAQEAGAQEQGDVLGVAGEGEPQQRRCDGRDARGRAVVLVALVLLVLVVFEATLFLVAVIVGAGRRGHPLFVLLLAVVGAQALEDRDQAPVAGGGHHVAEVLAGLQEHGHEDAGDLAVAGFLAQCPPDDLDDFDRRGAGAGEDDRADAALAPDVDPLAEDPAGREEGQLAHPPLGVDAVGIAGEDVAAVRGSVFTREPLRADGGRVGGGVGSVEPRG